MTPPLLTRTFTHLVHVTALLTLIVFGCLFWAFVFERPFLYYVNQPFPAASAVRAGEAVELFVERCSRSRHRRSYMTSHTMVNAKTGTAELLPDVWIDIEPGCSTSISRINVIPKNTQPGIYTVSGVALAEGIVLTHKVPWVSQPFEVLPALPTKEK